MAKLVPHKVHKYYKALLGKLVIYRCAIPDCSHYLRRDLVTNHMCICWNCGKPFILPKAPSLLKSKPWCKECEETRKAKRPDVEVPDDIMKKIMGSFD